MPAAQLRPCALGHSSTSTTLEIYAHKFKTEKESADRLQKLLVKSDDKEIKDD